MARIATVPPLTTAPQFLVPSSYRFLIWHDSGFSHTDWDTPLHPRIPGAGNIHMYITLVFNLDTQNQTHRHSIFSSRGNMVSSLAFDFEVLVVYNENGRNN